MTTPSPAEVAARVPYDAQAGSYRLVRSGSVGAEAVIAKLPAVDILVNNVGIFEPRPFAEIPDVDWYRLFEINVMSGVRLSRHYLAAMLERNWGRILFISSESGVQIPAEMVHYGMTKTAQIAVARGIAESVAGTGVTVNSILAGPTESEGVGAFVEAMAKQENKSKAELVKQFFEHVRPSSLLKRFATVDEVAADGDLPSWRGLFSDERGSTASRWRCREGDSLIRGGGSRWALIGSVQAALLFLGGGRQCRKARHPHISPA